MSLQLPLATRVAIAQGKQATPTCPRCGESTRLTRLVRTAPKCTGQRCLSCCWEGEALYTLDGDGRCRYVLPTQRRPPPAIDPRKEAH